MSWGNAIKSGLNRMGYELRRKQAPVSYEGPKDAFVDQYRFLPSGAKVIFDVGANRGSVTRQYRELFGSVEIHSFEPFPERVAKLREDFAGDPRVFIHDLAVADAVGERDFFLTKFDPSNSLLPRSISTRRYYPLAAPPTTHIRVKTTTLDAFVEQHDISHIDILKFDIQGGELMALRGAVGLLQAKRISVIYTEVLFATFYENQPVFHEIAAFLAGFGYTFFDLYHVAHATNGQIKYGDGIFISPATRSTVLDAHPDEP